MSATAVAVVQPDLSPLVSLVLDAVHSDHTRRAYGRHLRLFLAWVAERRMPFSRSTVQAYRAEMEAGGASGSAVNQMLSSVKRLSAESCSTGWISGQVDYSIQSIHGTKRLGVRSGTWLTKTETEKILELPDATTLAGKRDKALLGLLFGCGLRRSEACHVTFSHLQMRDGRWALIDIVGKGKRVRSVGVAFWCYRLIDDWRKAAGLTEGRILRRVNRADRIERAALSESGLWYIVSQYSQKIGVHLAPHDARRTWAKLARKGGAPLDAIQVELGHASVETTMRYVNTALDLEKTVCDYLGIGD